MLTDFAGKVAFLTGAAGGIGFALATALGNEGMKVAISDIDMERAGAAAEELRARGVDALGVCLDVTDRKAWSEAADRVATELGPIQLLCNNAGVTAAPMAITALPFGAWDWVLSTNLTGTFNGIRVIAPRMAAAGQGGHIVNTASVQALIASPNYAAYNAAKFGILGLSETLAIELAPSGIGVSVLCPGATRTDLFGHSHKIAPEYVQQTTNARMEISHSLSPDQVASRVIEAIRKDKFYIITHTEYRPLIEARLNAIKASMTERPDEAAITNIGEIEEAAFTAYRAMKSAAEQ